MILLCNLKRSEYGKPAQTCHAMGRQSAELILPDKDCNQAVICAPDYQEL
jgi:hypothetical protein